MRHQLLPLSFFSLINWYACRFKSFVNTKQNCYSLITNKNVKVCGLKWSPDRQNLASGGNDNKLLVWNASASSAFQQTPTQTYTDHVAAVKAIAWSPHQHGLLASGGGTADRYDWIIFFLLPFYLFHVYRLCVKQLTNFSYILWPRFFFDVLILNALSKRPLDFCYSFWCDYFFKFTCFSRVFSCRCSLCLRRFMKSKQTFCSRKIASSDQACRLSWS